jgi:gamma-glutamyltranspeptidase/glutathione hydrolase
MKARIAGAPPFLVMASAIVLLAGCAGAPAPPATPAPDAGKRVVAEHGAVASANPYASDAGLAMLRQGGNAIDAAVATAFALGVVEPQMSGLGGSGSMLIWLQREGLAEYLDFYAAQPADAFRGHTGPAEDEGRDLRVVGVPGEVAGLLAAHERFGRLDRATVMGPAIRLAREGFPINQVLSQMIASDSTKLHQFAGAALFYRGGKPLGPGERIRNPELAESLLRVAEQGVEGFYRGPTAEAVLGVMNNGGHPITPARFADYEPQWKRPLCTEYHGLTVLSASPPQTGIQIVHTLELLEGLDLDSLGLPTRSASAFDAITSALRVASTVRRFNGDPRWVEVNARGFASEGYARERADLVGTRTVPETVEPLSAEDFADAPYPEACVTLDPWRGLETPGEATAAGTAASTIRTVTPLSDLPTDSAGETTHISVVDADGNAVALSQTNSSVFGSGAFAAGFFLNDSGYRFSEEELEQPLPADWRTRTSTVAPTIVLEDARAVMVVGAPGGGRIPTAITQTMVYVLDYSMDPLEAVRMPRIFPDPNERAVQLEGGFSAEVLEDARSMGYEPTALSFGYARLYMIVRAGDRWIAVSDPRHDGEPRGY